MIDAIRVACSCVVLFALLAACGDDAATGRAGSMASPTESEPRPADRAATAAAEPVKAVLDAPGFYAGEAGLTPSQRAGREIWYKATAGNARFHTYVFQQRLNVLVDWYRVLNARERDDRFKAWGLINDPGCCMPGAEACPARSFEETYGFQWCPGDDQLLPYVGREGYRDPACDFRDAPVDAADPHAKAGDQRQSPCDLAFGTSTGALGYRKFPNPRFDRERWLALNGSLASWEGYRGALSTKGPPSDAGRNRLADGSIEPPFLIGTTCGSCHISFDPLNPPADPANPAWENLKGALGNQYTRVSEILTSGMPGTTLEVQMFSYTRPGTTDTSAIPSDQVYNPGTMNAIINTSVRPVFAEEQVVKWRKVSSCETPGGKPQASSCWCEPGRDGKCWQRALQAESVHHILKGGEDSIGAHEAVQRVYFNIGSCSEQCWLNHLTDLRQLDPTMRNFGQTPFDIGQCRRDCPNFRAIEDRLGNIVDFLMSPETNATDLRAARERTLRQRKPTASYTQADFERELNARFGAGAVERGRAVFAANCARCHSSIPVEQGGDFAGRDFHVVNNDVGLRADWMGSDRATPVTEVGTTRCRALHSNHMTGHIWQEYGSETLRARDVVSGIPEPHDGGRGYYRNISLLSAWAHAPFMHTNAIGPELCGKPTNATNDFYRSPYVGANGRALPPDRAPACRTYDPSVDGRFELYVASMTDLLHPSARVPKVARFDQDVVMPLGPRTWDGREEKQIAGFRVVLPAGTSVNGVASFRHKAFANDLLLAKLHPDRLDSRLASELGREAAAALANDVKQLSREIVADPERLVDALRSRPRVAAYYSSCTDLVENRGHPFGEGLSPADKKALIAFVATL
ncbi:MAG TPA: hypothetical protein VF055_13475 [Steroidobacteraceae bacterium]